METEIAKEMDELFSEQRATETVAAGEAVGLLGMVIRKCATSKEMSADESRAMMQRGYLVAEQVQKWADQEGDEEIDDSIQLPVDLMAAVRKDADGQDAEVIPISKAMEIIKEKLGTDQSDGDKTGDQDDGDKTVDWSMAPVTKSDEDDGEGDPPTNDDDWGADPEGVKTL